MLCCGISVFLKLASAIVCPKVCEDKPKELLTFEETAYYQCEAGYTAGGEPDAPDTIKVECLPTGEFSSPPVDMQCRNVNDCERHTCGPKGTCVAALQNY